MATVLGKLYKVAREDISEVRILAVQVNVKLDEKLVAQVEQLVEKGLLKTKKEAFEEALKLLLKSRKAQEIQARIDRIREGTEAMPSVTEAAIRSHEEEDH